MNPALDADLVQQRREQVHLNAANGTLVRAAQSFMTESIRARYSYNFDWLSRPIIQYPQDIASVQEIIWRVKPDLIIETGIAHGGSLVLSASMLALLDYADAVAENRPLIPTASRRCVVGIDVEIRAHNRAALDAHALRHKMQIIEGSSVSEHVVAAVRALAATREKAVVFLDSNHTHDHVLNELRAYAPLVSPGSYCVVFDTIIERLPPEAHADRPWAPGNSPMTAVESYLEELRAGQINAADGDVLAFEIDRQMDAKLLISAAPRGYLRRTCAVGQPLPA